MGVENLVEVDITIIARDYFRLRLYFTQDGLDVGQLFGRHLRGLVEQDDIAELHLLNDQTCQIVIVEVVALQFAAFGKLIAQP